VNRVPHVTFETKPEQINRAGGTSLIPEVMKGLNGL